MTIKFRPDYVDHDAFMTDYRGEMSRILRGIADRVEAGYREGSIHDINGNYVGEWEDGNMKENYD